MGGVVEISQETLEKSFSSMADDELLRRWKAQLFTDEARPVAEAEVQRRGLDVSDQAFQRLQEQDLEDRAANRRRQKRVVSRILFRVVMGILGTAGGAIALLIFGGR